MPHLKLSLYHVSSNITKMSLMGVSRGLVCQEISPMALKYVARLTEEKRDLLELVVNKGRASVP